MKPVSDLLPYVLPDVPGCSDPLAEREILSAVIQLCAEANMLKRTVSGLNLTVNVPRVQIAVPSGYALATVLAVTYRGTPLNPLSEDYLDLAWGNQMQWEQVFHYHRHDGISSWRAYTQPTPEAYFLEREDSSDFIRLVGIPQATTTDAQLAYQMSVKPLRAATEVDDFIVEDYCEEVARGALARLLAMGKQPWTDKARAKEFREEFERDISKAHAESLKSFTRDDQVAMRVTSHP